jgi:hypothetical protein
MMIVQSVQCHMAADCTGRMTVQLMWKGTVDADMDRYIWTNHSVTCVTTARVTCGTSIWLMWQGRTVVRHVAGTMACD